ncbi:MAG: hypothetical protein WC781_03385 [Candidatus Pacearchaeota archaeon]|jgi:hypothetical protein
MIEERELDVVVGRIKEIVSKNKSIYQDSCEFILDSGVRIYCRFIPNRFKIGDKVEVEGLIDFDGHFNGYKFTWLNPQTKLENYSIKQREELENGC